MRINLVNPGQLDARGRLIRYRKEWNPGLTLPYLAALIPPGHDIKIINDSVRAIDFEEPVDLVAITAMTSRVTRAYQIADEYRRRGVPVIMGGFHASFLKEEALEHCDAVVVKEAEGLFETILSDLERGQLKKVYQRDSWHSLENLPTPRYDLIDYNDFLFPFYPVQVVRGCPNMCEFCCVTKFYGNTYRYRPIDDVMRDLEQTGPLVSFIDDNLIANQDYAMELFERMRPLKRFFLMLADIGFAKNEKLLRVASEAGCFVAYVGLESIQRRSLHGMSKALNLPEEYPGDIRRMKKYQIELFASMIVGFEKEKPEDLEDLKRFLLSAKVPYLYLYILAPLPGTRLFEKVFTEAGRKPPPWEFFDACHAVSPPETMTKEMLEEKYWEIQKWFYSWPNILRRLVYPLHFALIFFNWITLKKVNLNIHPWMGIPMEGHFGLPARIVSFLVGNATVRRISRWIRFRETIAGERTG